MASSKTTPQPPTSPSLILHPPSFTYTPCLPPPSTPYNSFLTSQMDQDLSPRAGFFLPRLRETKSLRAFFTFYLSVFFLVSSGCFSFYTAGRGGMTKSGCWVEDEGDICPFSRVILVHLSPLISSCMRFLTFTANKRLIVIIWVISRNLLLYFFVRNLCILECI